MKPQTILQRIQFAIRDIMFLKKLMICERIHNPMKHKDFINSLLNPHFYYPLVANLFNRFFNSTNNE
ncbi:hypothetical protein CF108_14890 [Aeromonas veronii]|nr:hypothetical protein CF108_14890 [Aeromonas veronii]